MLLLFVGLIELSFSYLEQKYRMSQRQILPKEDHRRWPQHRDMVARSYYPHRPIMAFPPYHSNHMAYPIWGLHGNHQPSIPFWSPANYPAAWQPAENHQWKLHCGVRFDVYSWQWGCKLLNIRLLCFLQENLLLSLTDHVEQMMLSIHGSCLSYMLMHGDALWCRIFKGPGSLSLRWVLPN